MNTLQLRRISLLHYDLSFMFIVYYSLELFQNQKKYKFLNTRLLNKISRTTAKIYSILESSGI